MPRLALVPILLLGGCLFAGLYGIMHDQLTYTISPDYFHAFKFHQFQIDESLRNRVGVVLIGWLATWWMGCVIGLPILSVGWILPDARSYAKHSLIAFAIAAATALLIGIGALAYGLLSIGPESLPDFWYPEGPIDRVAFARVGMMHNFSYLGGFTGIFVAIAYLAIVRRRLHSSV